MDRKIIRPTGNELLRYYNEGYPICNECDAIMDRVDSKDGKAPWYVCPACGYKVLTMEYEYTGFEPDDSDDEDRIPVGCAACGGPYPQCKTSCKLFDD